MKTVLSFSTSADSSLGCPLQLVFVIQNEMSPCGGQSNPFVEYHYAWEVLDFEGIGEEKKSVTWNADRHVGQLSEDKAIDNNFSAKIAPGSYVELGAQSTWDTHALYGGDDNKLLAINNSGSKAQFILGTSMEDKFQPFVLLRQLGDKKGLMTGVPFYLQIFRGHGIRKHQIMKAEDMKEPLAFVEFGQTDECMLFDIGKSQTSLTWRLFRRSGKIVIERISSSDHDLKTSFNKSAEGKEPITNECSNKESSAETKDEAQSSKEQKTKDDGVTEQQLESMEVENTSKTKNDQSPSESPRDTSPVTRRSTEDIGSSSQTDKNLAPLSGSQIIREASSMDGSTTTGANGASSQSSTENGLSFSEKTDVKTSFIGTEQTDTIATIEVSLSMEKRENAQAIKDEALANLHGPDDNSKRTQQTDAINQISNTTIVDTRSARQQKAINDTAKPGVDLASCASTPIVARGPAKETESISFPVEKDAKLPAPDTAQETPSETQSSITDNASQSLEQDAVFSSGKKDYAFEHIKESVTTEGSSARTKEEEATKYDDESKGTQEASTGTYKASNSTSTQVSTQQETDTTTKMESNQSSNIRESLRNTINTSQVSTTKTKDTKLMSEGANGGAQSATPDMGITITQGSSAVTPEASETPETTVMNGDVSMTPNLNGAAVGLHLIEIIRNAFLAAADSISSQIELSKADPR